MSKALSPKAEAAARRAMALVDVVNVVGTDPHDRMADLAERFADEGVRELPNNRGPWVKLFMRGDTMAWCAGFLLWMATALYAPLPWAPRRILRYWNNRSVKTWVKNAKRGGTFIGAAIIPQRGWAVFISGRSGSDRGVGTHVAIVVRVHHRADGVIVLELVSGNYGDAVRRHTLEHQSRTIIGYHAWVDPRA